MQFTQHLISNTVLWRKEVELRVLNPSIAMCAGAGKSTLLDVLAMQTVAGRVSGDIWLNGVQASRASLHRMTAYVSQVKSHLQINNGNLVWVRYNASRIARMLPRPCFLNEAPNLCSMPSLS